MLIIAHVQAQGSGQAAAAAPVRSYARVMRAAAFVGQRPAQRRSGRQWRSAGGGAPHRQLVVLAVKAGDSEQLPIFPLSMVALPAADVPLQIFEARYRVLFSTLLAGAEGLEDGLINPEKPWCGTRRFGLSFFDPQSSSLSSVGTVLEIKAHKRKEDGRLLVENIGRERYRIKRVVEEKPVLVCEVEYLDSSSSSSAADEAPQAEEVKQLAQEVAQLFRNVVSLSVKLRDSTLAQGQPLTDPAQIVEMGPAMQALGITPRALKSLIYILFLTAQDLQDPSQLTELGPTELSFWIASLFQGNPYQQQALLEMESTLERLKTEQEILEGTFKYLSAQAALKSAFSSSTGTGGESGAVPPPGGPD